MSTPKNPPAFARAAHYDIDNRAPSFACHEPQEGMSLRDYFAAAAAQGLCANANYNMSDGPGPKQFPASVAFSAYEIADAMLAERENKSS